MAKSQYSADSALFSPLSLCPRMPGDGTEDPFKIADFPASTVDNALPARANDVLAGRAKASVGESDHFGRCLPDDRTISAEPGLSGPSPAPTISIN
jgi:hypothetical protein